MLRFGPLTTRKVGECIVSSSPDGVKKVAVQLLQSGEGARGECDGLPGPGGFIDGEDDLERATRVASGDRGRAVLDDGADEVLDLHLMERRETDMDLRERRIRFDVRRVHLQVLLLALDG